MIEIGRFDFKGVMLIAYEAEYVNNKSTAVTTYSEEEEPYGKLSVNLPADLGLPKGTFVAKTFGGEAELCKWAIKSDLFEDTGEVVEYETEFDTYILPVWRIKRT